VHCVMKKSILCAIASCILVSTTITILCYILEAHRGIKRLSEAGFYSLLFCLALILCSAIVVSCTALTYSLKNNLEEQTNNRDDRTFYMLQQQTVLLEACVALHPDGKRKLNKIWENRVPSDVELRHTLDKLASIKKRKNSNNITTS
jgi:hypothetical protein